MPVDKKAFLVGAKPLFGKSYSRSQQDGLFAIIDEWNTRFSSNDIRWLSYILTTAYHETAHTMQPVRETFWLSEDWRRKHFRYYPYYGRGYVQLTWKDKYAIAGKFVRDDLVSHPDLALRPDYATAIAFVGMTQGWFRGDKHGRHTLARYFNSKSNDPVGARNIVNGYEKRTIGGKKTSVAAILASYHHIFLKALSGESRLVEHDGYNVEDDIFVDDNSGEYFSLDQPENHEQVIDELELEAKSAQALTVDLLRSYLSKNTLAPDQLPDLYRKMISVVSEQRTFDDSFVET